MAPQAWYCTARAKTAHCYDPFDSRFPMRASCGHTEEPQRLFHASTIDRHQDRPIQQDSPVYCERCLKEA